MAGIHDVVVIEDDDFIMKDDNKNIDLDGDIENIGSAGGSCRPRPGSRIRDDKLPPTSSVSSINEPIFTRSADSIQKTGSSSRINSTSGQADWDIIASPYTSSSQTGYSTSPLDKIDSFRDSRSSEICPLPISGPEIFGGSAEQPIHLDGDVIAPGKVVTDRREHGRIRRVASFSDEDIEMGMGRLRRQQAGSLARENNGNSDSAKLHNRRCNGPTWTFLHKNFNEPFSRGDRAAAPPSSLERAPYTRNKCELIDLVELEDDAGEGVEMLQIEEVYEEEIEARKQSRKKSSLRYDRRNPSISRPWQRTKIACVNSATLKPNKTIQTKDGGLLRIKDILQNTETLEIRLRGHRLQRARDLNGLLEKKLNELVLFLEVDQDDPRLPAEQSTVEVGLNDFDKIRSVRFTNQKFPFARNCDPKEFRDNEHAALEGGLTVRWKYTCIYENAADRHHNVYKERSLERLKADECTPGFEIPDGDRRTHWRGETVPGGAHRPSSAVQDVIVIPDSPRRRSTSVACTSDMVELMMNGEGSHFLSEDTSKRTYSAISAKSAETSNSGPATKRTRQENGGVEETREGVSRIDLESAVCWSTMSITHPRQQAHQADSVSTIDLPSDYPPTIDLVSPEPPKPKPRKIPRQIRRKPNAPKGRIAGQAYTYGDAFCGGGGSSRGATMAGLRLNWGFDFNKHACLSWQANFPSSQCHQMAAHEFVDQARRATDSGHPDNVKVDILHLSPPCQFFSPAHTINGSDDEMNIASLFAVQMVIDVSRPRVVTLEQTFGIACPRFRFYFNALIQMFTTHDFSVRWAIVPLAQWGLPQRRMRLIVIASCPGEILPNIPSPTHSAPGSDSSLGLPPFVSANETLKSVPAGAADHDIDSVMWAPDRWMPPWDGSKILPRSMTTSGGQNYHPSGTRELTLREYACLQGFPPCHVFRGNYVKKQIGNAVPPVVAKVLFGSIKADLEKIDGIEGPELIE